MYILGFDIGGTKCAAVTAEYDGEVRILKKHTFPTDTSLSAEELLFRLFEAADAVLDKKPDKIGISCGGPLDAKNGIILSPPNLKNLWGFEIVRHVEKRYGVPVRIQNDANACAVAEWKFGAGRGHDNLIFMTFGTGLGAGLILNGALYSGTNDNAGELGHVRLSSRGPIGFGKAGSFEGFCSGGGIARLGYKMALSALKKGICPSYYKERMRPEDVSAKTLADAARLGDATAKEVYRISGKFLGRGLSLVIDILNPELIILGGIFTRSSDLLLPSAKKEIEREALAISAGVCDILPSSLGENIGDYGAIATAIL